MAVNRLASQCPAVQVASTFRKLADAYATSGGTAPSSSNFNTGDSSTLPGKLNRNALATDLGFRYGGSAVRAIGQGLVISYSGSFAIAVTAGHAIIDGVAELSANASGVAVVTGWNYIWLTQAGTVQVTSTTAPPSAQSCFIGAVNVASGGGSATVDTSGVVSRLGDTLWRETADTGAPSDTPSASATGLLTKTLSGVWLWYGSAWEQITGLATLYGPAAWGGCDTVQVGNFTLPGAYYRATFDPTTTAVATLPRIAPPGQPTLVGKEVEIENISSSASTKTVTLAADAADSLQLPTNILSVQYDVARLRAVKTGSSTYAWRLAG